MKKLILIIVVVAGFFSFQIKTGLSQSSNVTLTSKWLKPGQCRNIFVSGDYAYVGSGSVISIFDISDTTKITGKGQYYANDYISWITVQNDYAYVLTSSSMEVVDVSNPVQPQETGSYSMGGNVVSLSGSYAYIAAGDSGLRVVDITNPAQPNEVAVYGQGNYFVNSVFVSGNYAYLATLYGGLQILDVSLPDNPVWVSSFPGHSSISNVFVSGNYAYLIDDGRLCILDITNPLSPDSMSTSGGSILSTPLFISGNLAITSENDMYCIWDISNPASPTEVGSTNSEALSSIFDGMELSIDGNRAFLPYFDVGFHIVDISNPALPTIKLKYYDEDVFYNIKSGDYVYLTEKGDFAESVLNIYDISDIQHPQYINQYDSIGFSAGNCNIKKWGNYILITNSYPELQIIDVSNPLQITSAGSYDLLNANIYSLGIDVSGNNAFVCMQDSGLYIIDISNVASPTKISSILLQNGYKAQQVFVSGNFAYVTDNINTIHVIDISNIANPVERDFLQLAVPGQITYPDGDYISISGNLAYVSLHDKGLAIVDISNPDSLSLVNLYTAINEVRQVALIGHYIFAVDYLSGLQVIDVSNPANPVEAGYYFDAGNYSISVSADTNYIYFSVYGGLYIFENDFSNGINNPDKNDSQFTFFPNPAKDELFIGLPKTNGEYTVSIISTNGKVVDKQIITNTNSLINTGNLPKGIYLLKVNGNHFSGTAKFVKE